MPGSIYKRSPLVRIRKGLTLVGLRTGWIPFLSSPAGMQLPFGQGMVGASNLNLLGVGAEKSSLYRLGLLGFDAYLIIMKRGRFDKGAFKPFCWIVGLQPRPIE